MGDVVGAIREIPAIEECVPLLQRVIEMSRRREQDKDKGYLHSFVPLSMATTVLSFQSE